MGLCHTIQEPLEAREEGMNSQEEQGGRIARSWMYLGAAGGLTACVVGTIVLQNLGLAPQMKFAR
jgi:hypothetical protein